MRGLRRDRVCRCAGGRGLSLRGNAPVVQEDATCMSLQAVGLACAWLSSCARRRIARSARWPRNVLNQKLHTFHGLGAGGGNLFFDAIFSRQSCFFKNVIFYFFGASGTPGPIWEATFRMFRVCLIGLDCLSFELIIF